MNEKIEKVLSGSGGNYILPFFWQHGESEEVLRHYMKVIHECGIGAVCVESRPHPDYCGPKWWMDMDVILDEARKRDMKVWILDDSHFPTGYCNGALEDGPDELRRQSVTYRVVAQACGGETVSLKRQDYETPPPFERNLAEQYLVGEIKTFADDVLLGVAAVRLEGGNGGAAAVRPESQEGGAAAPEHVLTDAGTAGPFLLEEEDGTVTWTAPEGRWKLYACYLTRNRGPHRDYMNMMDRESCYKLIEAVYQPHYDHYKEDFGRTIAGFFSDEPELGNGHLYQMNLTMEEVEDLPWSRELQEELEIRWGGGWLKYIPLLWEKDSDPDLKAAVRYDYMDVVTRCVERDFSLQVSDWCHARGVEYIGHLIEDNNQHSRCGSSLGHFFRGLAGQDMAGIDDIGGQVLPQCEDARIRTNWSGDRDGVFYHYALGKLGASAAAIEPLKKGRTMCEIFGNYGWEEGIALEKYLADHFMVRGVNRFVPHAFSAADFPDPDCPPHFYAHGNNPQYRHFGRLMGYMNRICELISDGCHVAPAAILYHGEADWTGGNCMFSQEPARMLADCQIDYDFIPSDVFSDEKYGTALGKTLKVNTQEYRVLIVPETSYVTVQLAEAVEKLTQYGFPVLFVNSCPVGIVGRVDRGKTGGERDMLLSAMRKCPVVGTGELADYVKSLGIGEVAVSPAQPLIRYLHYKNGNDLYYFMNESAQVYRGSIVIKQSGACYGYNGWDNRLEELDAEEKDGGTVLSVSLEPRKSLIVVFDEPDIRLFRPAVIQGTKLDISSGWTRSTCSAPEYPAFGHEKEVDLPDHLENEQPGFGGFVRYVKEVDMGQTDPSKGLLLEIMDAAEGVEVFVNGVSAGIQVVPVYRYDISGLMKMGQNEIAIEVATTLERVVPRKSRIPGRPVPLPSNRCGICGRVNLWFGGLSQADYQADCQ